jgi:hypothetical protein
MRSENEPTTSKHTDGNVPPPEEDTDETRLRLNKQTLQDLGTSDANADKVRGGQATIRRCY